MQWIHNFDLFLFDFDGLLTNTEELHYKAYKRMCAERGFDLDWDFARYCKVAHYESDAIRFQIYDKFPELEKLEPSWPVLYLEKKKYMIELLNSGDVEMMPGAERLLKALDEANIKRCVVTNSPLEQIKIIQKHQPILKTIPNWVTRENYKHAKPHPECYEYAIKTYANEKDRIIGFEDTPRGMWALMKTRALPVMVCAVAYPEIPDLKKAGALHYQSFDELLEKELY